MPTPFHLKKILQHRRKRNLLSASKSEMYERGRERGRKKSRKQKLPCDVKSKKEKKRKHKRKEEEKRDKSSDIVIINIVTYQNKNEKKKQPVCRLIMKQTAKETKKQKEWKMRRDINSKDRPGLGPEESNKV